MVEVVRDPAKCGYKVKVGKRVAAFIGDETRSQVPVFDPGQFYYSPESLTDVAEEKKMSSAGRMITEEVTVVKEKWLKVLEIIPRENGFELRMNFADGQFGPLTHEVVRVFESYKSLQVELKNLLGA